MLYLLLLLQSRLGLVYEEQCVWFRGLVSSAPNSGRGRRIHWSGQRVEVITITGLATTNMGSHSSLHLCPYLVPLYQFP